MTRSSTSWHLRDPLSTSTDSATGRLGGITQNAGPDAAYTHGEKSLSQPRWRGSIPRRPCATLSSTRSHTRLRGHATNTTGTGNASPPTSALALALSCLRTCRHRHPRGSAGARAAGPENNSTPRPEEWFRAAAAPADFKVTWSWSGRDMESRLSRLGITPKSCDICAPQLGRLCRA